jgi:hypothetical protein
LRAYRRHIPNCAESTFSVARYHHSGAYTSSTNTASKTAPRTKNLNLQDKLRGCDTRFCAASNVADSGVKGCSAASRDSRAGDTSTSGTFRHPAIDHKSFISSRDHQRKAVRIPYRYCSSILSGPPAVSHCHTFA